jgi:subtilase family serine protease
LFALRHTEGQLAALEAQATEVSNPDSTKFRQYSSLEEVQQRFNPPREAEEVVLNFLQQALGINNASAPSALPLGAFHSNEAASESSTPSSPSASTPSPRIFVRPGGFVQVEGVSVAQAAELLRTEFNVFERVVDEEEEEAARRLGFDASDSDSEEPVTSQPPALGHSPSAGDRVISAAGESGGFALPAHVAAQVDFVGGVTKLPSTRFQARIHRIRSEGIKARPLPTKADSSSAESTMATQAQSETEAEATAAPGDSYTVTPAFLREQYNIPASARGSFSQANRQAIPSFLEQFYSEFDLQLYLRLNGLPSQNISRVRGLNVPALPGGEASLDTQLMVGVAPGILTEFWSFAGRRDNTLPPSSSNQEPFLEWLLTLAADPSPPLVHSVSYADDEKDGTPEYNNRLNVEFQKAAIRGISILFASGDDGIASVDARTDPVRACKQHHPNFPSSSPWITSVGGTQLKPRGPIGKRGSAPGSRSGTEAHFPAQTREEIVCSASTGCAVTTGGGFSHTFPRPAWQAAEVDAYLERARLAAAAAASSADPSSRGMPLVPPSSWFNSSARAYPDVSILATHYTIIVGGRSSRTGGTSASAPVMAAMVSLWNEQLLRAGRPPLGFLNPWLYSLARNAQAGATAPPFRDVLSGDNACSQMAGRCCPYGFGATEGFDAVSGLGTPDFEAISKLL